MVFLRFRSLQCYIFFIHINKFNPELEIIFPSHGHQRTLMILHDTLSFKAIHYHSLSVRMLEGRNFDHSTLWVMSLSLSATHIMQHSKFQKMYLLFGVWSVVCGAPKSFICLSSQEAYFQYSKDLFGNQFPFISPLICPNS